MKRTRSLLWLLCAAILMTATSPNVLACTACFGKSDSNMANGMNMGIFALLLVITSVLCGVASFFVFIARRSHHLQEAHVAQTTAENRTNA
jgi:hypothetical protein